MKNPEFCQKLFAFFCEEQVVTEDIVDEVITPLHLDFFEAVMDSKFLMLSERNEKTFLESIILGAKKFVPLLKSYLTWMKLRKETIDYLKTQQYWIDRQIKAGNDLQFLKDLLVEKPVEKLNTQNGVPAHLKDIDPRVHFETDEARLQPNEYTGTADGMQLRPETEC